ncbi:MAG: zinc-ribbon domain-containing protein, partial [Anaerolineae bacterium]
MHCPACGAYYNEEDLFCGECGRPLSTETPP